jgi:hypothetical protein
MPKKPKIDHEYHAGKDRFEINIRGYALSMGARNEIMKKLMAAVEHSPDRLIAGAKKRKSKKPGKELRGVQKTTKLIEIGD